jgi:phage terminase large subunit GpA-like protein
MLPSEWAAQKFYLSPESSAESGKYRPERTPFHAGIVDAPFEEENRETYVMAGKQWGKTTCELIVLGYLAEIRPIPILWVAPTIQMAEATSKDRIGPMFRDCPSLRSLLKSARSRDSGNTILHKELTNGMVVDLAGANSEASLASRPKGVILFDEIVSEISSISSALYPNGIRNTIIMQLNKWNKILNKIIIIVGHGITINDSIKLKLYNSESDKTLLLYD